MSWELKKGTGWRKEEGEDVAIKTKIENTQK